MNKRYLPAIAAILIAISCTTFVPVFGQQLPALPTFIYAAPTLTVVTIAQDDEMRATGVMWLATDYAHYIHADSWATDRMSQFKLLVAYNGVPVTPATLTCQYVEKDKYNAIKDKQFPAENLETVPKDVTGYFICKPRWIAPGVGVLDVYYTGTGAPQVISDYILSIQVTYAVGRNTVWGTDLQDICLLGWPSLLATVPAYMITKPDGTLHYVVDDALFGWGSCEDLALVEKAQLGVPIPWI